MLKPRRIDAGLGDPPSEYTTNDVEAANGIIKHGLSFDSKKPHEFVEEIKKIVDVQFNNEDRAVLNRGPYSVAEPFKHLAINDSKWSRMSLAQRKSAIKKFSDTGMDVQHNGDGGVNDRKTAVEGNDSAQQHPLVELSISASESGITNIPLPILQTMFEKAADLFSTVESIVLKPGGTDGSYVVAGHSNRILIVTPGKGGSLTCDRQCSNRSTGLCEHTLAVAARRGSLEEFLSWFKRAKKGPDLSAMALHGAAKNAGKKPSCRKRSNKKKDPIVAYVDLLQEKEDMDRQNVAQEHRKQPAEGYRSFPQKEDDLPNSMSQSPTVVSFSSAASTPLVALQGPSGIFSQLNCQHPRPSLQHWQSPLVSKV